MPNNKPTFFLKSIAPVFFVLLLNSCITPYKTIKIDILEPGSITLPLKSSTLVVYNCFYPFTLSNSEKEFPDSSLKLKIPEQLSVECMKGFYEEINTSLNFKEIVFAKPSQPIKIINKKDWNSINYICNLYSTDMLLILEKVKYKFKITECFDEDISSKTCYYDVQSGVKSYWYILNPTEKKVVDSFISYYSENQIIYNSTLSQVKEIYTDSIEFLKNMAYITGTKYGDRIVPKWTTVSRLYYHSGNKQMEEAASFAKNNEWENAIIVWQKIYESEEGKLKERAAMNIALAYEMIGILWKARMWALRSYRIGKSDESLNYANELYIRILKIKQIEEQIGFD